MKTKKCNLINGAYTVERRYNAVQFITIFPTAAAELKSNFKLTIDTPYIALMGELWSVYHEDFEENRFYFGDPPPATIVD